MRRRGTGFKGLSVLSSLAFRGAIVPCKNAVRMGSDDVFGNDLRRKCVLCPDRNGGFMFNSVREALDVTGDALGSAAWLHFRRFLAHPLRVRSVFPASEDLSRLIAAQIHRREDEFIVELGAGTGAVTRALLSRGIPACQLVVVEIDPEMADYLRASFPEVRVIAGDAFEVAKAVPATIVGKVSTVICGIPVAALGLERQHRLIANVRLLMSKGARLLVFGYLPHPPLPAHQLGLRRTGSALTLRNFPPGFVWTYELAK